MPNIFKIYNKDCRTISVCRSVVFENIVFEYLILLLILSRRMFPGLLVNLNQSYSILQKNTDLKVLENLSNFSLVKKMSANFLVFPSY